jgi:hypothetical protein
MLKYALFLLVVSLPLAQLAIYIWWWFEIEDKQKKVADAAIEEVEKQIEEEKRN